MPSSMSDADRETVRGFAAVLGHHMVSLSLNESMPALPLVGLAPPTEVTIAGTTTATGIPTGTRIGIVTPMVTVRADYLDAVGALGELAAP